MYNHKLTLNIDLKQKNYFIVTTMHNNISITIYIDKTLYFSNLTLVLMYVVGEKRILSVSKIILKSLFSLILLEISLNLYFYINLPGLNKTLSVLNHQQPQLKSAFSKAYCLS